MLQTIPSEYWESEMENMADLTVPPDLASIPATLAHLQKIFHERNEQYHQSIREVHLIFVADTSATASARTLLKSWLIRKSVSMTLQAISASLFTSTCAATAGSQ